MDASNRGGEGQVQDVLPEPVNRRVEVVIMSDIGWLLFFVVAYSGVVGWSLVLTMMTSARMETVKIKNK